jgi:hypothetical protein
MALECAYARGYWSIEIEYKKTSSSISRMACEGRAEDIRPLLGAGFRRDQWAEGRRVEDEQQEPSVERRPVESETKG